MRLSSARYASNARLHSSRSRLSVLFGRLAFHARISIMSRTHTAIGFEIRVESLAKSQKTFGK